MGKITNFFSGVRQDENTPPPYFLRFRSSKGFILTTICVAVFTDIFLYGIIVPVMPFTLADRAGVPESSVQHWVSVLLSVYGAALLSISPLAGWMADRSSSRRLPLLFGLFTLGGATVLLCFAKTVSLLVLGRLMQGFSAAIVWTIGLALLVDTVGEKEIGITLGYVSISMTLGVLLAPLLGGIVYEKAGYYPVFYMAFALVAMDIVLRLVLIEKKIARQWEPELAAQTARIPTGGSQQSTAHSENTAVGIELEDYSKTDSDKMPTGKSSTETKNAASEQAPAYSRDDLTRALHSSASTINYGGSRLQSAGTTLHSPDSTLDVAGNSREANGSPELEDINLNNHEPVDEPTPTVQVNKWPPIFTLLKSRRVLAALFGCIIQASQLTAFDGVLPLFTQETFGWDSIGAGLIFLTIVVPSFTAPIIGWASDRFGPRWFVVIGFLLAIPFWILLRLVDHNSMDQKVLLCALLTLIGVALTLVMAPLMAEITYVVEAKDRKSPGCFGPNGAYAQAYGLFITAFAAGTLIGPIWAGYVKDAAGWGTMAWSLGITGLAGAVPCLIYTGGLITQNNAKTADERAAGVPIRPESATSAV